MSRLDFAPGEDRIFVDVEEARLDFETRIGMACDAGELRAVIKEAGYELGEVTVDGKKVP